MPAQRPARTISPIPWTARRLLLKPIAADPPRPINPPQPSAPPMTPPKPGERPPSPPPHKAPPERPAPIPPPGTPGKPKGGSSLMAAERVVAMNSAIVHLKLRRMVAVLVSCKAADTLSAMELWSSPCRRWP